MISRGTTLVRSTTYLRETSCVWMPILESRRPLWFPADRIIFHDDLHLRIRDRAITGGGASQAQQTWFAASQDKSVCAQHISLQ